MKIIIILLLLLIYFTNFAQLPKDNPNWEMVFNDEFNNLDLDKWLTSFPWGQGSYINVDWCNNLPAKILTNETQYPFIRKENCIVNNGIMELTSKKEVIWGTVWDRWVWGYCWELNYPTWCPVDTLVKFNYTTAQLWSKHVFKYGYFEVKCKMPIPLVTHGTKGLGPAFWMWSSGPFINWSEIDIFEFAGEHDGVVNTGISTVHYRKCSPSNYPNCSSQDTLHIGDSFSFGSINFNTFHTFGLLWLPDRITFFIDDVPFFTSTNHPDELDPMPIILGICHPTYNYCEFIEENTQFPYKFEIDYIRVYQPKIDCDFVVANCNYVPVNKIVKSISYGGNSCLPVITNGDNVFLNATDFVLLDYGFLLENGAQLSIELIPCTEDAVSKINKIVFPPPAPFDFYKRLKYKVN